MRATCGHRSFAARTVWLIGAIAIAIALPTPTRGEDDETEAEEDGLETLFVTAEKRVADLQQTGGSVVAFTESMLEDRGIYDVKSITEYVPNVKIHTNAAGNTGFAVNIRGALKGDPIISREPAVGLYLDEVYLSNMVGTLFDVLDLEAIEVLRGPQGTLYGRNTNGGAIKLRTKAPTDRISLRNDFTYGNFDALNNRTVANVPLFGDTPDSLLPFEALGSLNTRTAFAYLTRDGFIDAVQNSQLAPAAGYGPHTVGASRLDDVSRWAVHHRSQWQPIDSLTIDYIFDRTYVREEPSASQNTFVYPFGTPNANGLINGFTLAAFGFGIDISPLARAKRSDQVAQGLGAGGAPLSSELDVWGHAVTAEYALPALPVLGDAKLKTITAHRRKRNDDATDIDGTGFQIFESSLAIHHQQFSEELQINGVTDEGRVQYVAGVYYFRERGKATNVQDFLQDPVFDTVPGFAGGDPGFVVDFFHKVDKRSWAGYGQIDYTPPVLDERLTLSAGLRYTNEKVELDVLNINTDDVTGPAVVVDTGIGGAPNVTRPDDRFDDVSWLARVMYQFSDDIMGYFKVNTGFLAGGFNARNVNAITPFGIPYDPETLRSYELGVRTDLLERRVRFNGTFYYYDYEDIQISLFEPGSMGAATLVQNAASARLWGAELELVAQPYEGVEILIAYGHIDAEYDEFINNVGADVSNTSGFAQTPEHSVVVGGEYTLPAFSWGTVLGRMDWSWSSSVRFSDQAQPEIDEDSSWLLHGMIQVADLALPRDLGSARLQLWVKNITDEKFKEFGFSLGAFGWGVNTFTDPRTYGATFVWEWDR